MPRTWIPCAASPVLTGHPGLLRPKQQILGVDTVGQVEAVGSGVTRVRPGDEVDANLLERGYGGFAEYVSVPVKVLSLKPANLSFGEAARYRWRGHRPAAECGRRRLRKHWLLASFALHRWLDRPRIVKTADYRSRWRAQALSAEAPDQLTRRLGLRTDETTSRIA